MLENAKTDFDKFRAQAQDFFRWWLSELAACLPERLRRVTRIARDQWVMELNGAEAYFYNAAPSDDQSTLGGQLFDIDTDSERRATVVATLRARHPASDFVLRFPAKRTLRKVIKLPLAAEENLRGVLGFEMDQHTPFKADQTYYDYLILDRDQATQRLTVQMTVVPRELQDPALAKLAALGLYPNAVDVGAPGSTTPAINLLPVEQRSVKSQTSHKLTNWLAIAAGALLVASIAIPIAKRAAHLNEIREKLVVTEKEAKAAESLRNQIESLSTQSAFLSTQKKHSAVMVSVLNELTKLLPDDTWLYQFELNGKEASIQGESPTSSAIIGLIESSRLFKNAQFRSPVTQNRQTNAERFNISAEVDTGPTS